MKKWLPKTILITAIALAIVGFSDFGESMYWSLARPFSAVLFIVWLTHRLLAAESEQYEQDDYARAFNGAQKKAAPGKPAKQAPEKTAFAAAAPSH